MGRAIPIRMRASRHFAQRRKTPSPGPERGSAVRRHRLSLRAPTSKRHLALLTIPVAWQQHTPPQSFWGLWLTESEIRRGRTAPARVLVATACSGCRGFEARSADLRGFRSAAFATQTPQTSETEVCATPLHRRHQESMSAPPAERPPRAHRDHYRGCHAHHDSGSTGTRRRTRRDRFHDARFTPRSSNGVAPVRSL
jgi:hypothetical protein